MHRTIRYVRNGTDPETGMECWPWVRYAFQLMQVDLPEDVYEAAKHHFRLVAEDEPKHLFDVVYMTNSANHSKHVGILLENPRWIMHCSGPTNGVARSELTRSGWQTLPKAYWRLKVFDYED